MYVTLEPCNGQGRTGPCTEAIIESGIGRVVIAQRDPHAKGRGGVERLRAAGVRVEIVEEPMAIAVGAPFVHRIETGLPWVVAKWAQTIDGCIATRTGSSKWISGVRSRAMVHRERGRVDAILTGIGTVLADDPRLTARDVRVRRVARRVVVDRDLGLLDAHGGSPALLATLDVAPLTVACREALARPDSSMAIALRRRGVEVVGLPFIGDGAADDGAADDTATNAAPSDRRLALAPLLRHLVGHHSVATLLVEAGPGLLGSLFDQGLVNEAWVFTAPSVLGDPDAPRAVGGRVAPELVDGLALRLVDLRRRGEDVMTRWRVVQGSRPLRDGGLGHG
ncbi:MAG: bifunctional diaminohydroxyphosphoribosylaminopyrimidine deaminase/5-amino-6-(5-phosphoribosylamino)uracil reductase RibD [Phycisphaerales bacterium]